MKKILISILFVVAGTAFAQNENIDQNAVELSRILSKDIFDDNGVPFTEPLVIATNATSNSGFFIDSYIPRKDSFYVKFSVNTMLGFVPDRMKTYSPEFPSEQFNITNALQYITVQNGEFGITDTVGLYSYLLRTLFYDGIQDGSIELPDETATIFGSSNEEIIIREGSLAENANDRIDNIEETINQFPGGGDITISDSIRNEILNTLNALPGFFSLPRGANVNTLFFAVPQIEVGSFLGTEVLLRVIPALDYGETIGEFGFYGVGLKHSISQYFFDSDEERTFDMAIQSVYQHTTLENEIGLTGAKLTSGADIFNINLQASTSINNWFDVYGGISYETINIDADFTYFLPVEAQAQLGLRRVDRNQDGTIEKIYEPEPPDYPGDTKPQTSTLKVEDTNIKLILGIKKDFGPASIFASFNYSEFNILNSGIQVRF